MNVDNQPLPGVDFVCDLEKFPWPIQSASASSILAKDIVEHLNDLGGFLKEAHRVLEPGGTLLISAPHFTSRSAHVDPTHRRSLAFDTLDFFTVGHERAYYWDFTFSERRSSQIVFDRNGPYIWNVAIEWLVNRNDRMRRAYESTPLRVFPAMNVSVCLVK